MKSIGLLNYNIPTLRRLAKINKKELFFQIKCELQKGIYSTLSSDRDILPNTIYFEPESYCANRCQDCYVPIEDRKHDIQLSDNAISQITEFSRVTKIPYLTVMWWDPFDDTVFDKTYKILLQNPNLRFMICNDGISLMQGDKLDKIHKLVNTSLVFSIDGFEETNDKIRGKWAFKKTIESLEAYSDHGKHLTGTLSTIRPSNIQEVTSPDFLNFITDTWGNYIAYSNVYKEQGWKYVLSSEEYADRIVDLMKMSEKLPASILTSQFGQINPRKISLKDRLHAIAIDYKWNMFSSRRGESLWNINDSPTALKDIVYGDEFKSIFNNKHRDLNFKAVSYTDKRYDGFLEEVIERLVEKGVYIEKPR